MKRSIKTSVRERIAKNRQRVRGVAEGGSVTGTQSFSGRKLLQHIPCRPAFDGSGLGAGVTACEPYAAHIDPERMTTRPARTFGAPQINAAHDLFLEAIFPRTDSALHLELREGLLERTQPEPYPENCKRQDIAFTPSQIAFNATHFPAAYTVRVESGPHAGNSFTHSRRHWLMVVDCDCPASAGTRGHSHHTCRPSQKKRLGESKALDNQADAIAKLLPTESDGNLRCIACGKNEIDADGFLLCFWCNTQGIQDFLVDGKHLDFGMETLRASLRKNRRFQDDSEAEKVSHYPLLDTPVSAGRVTEIKEKAQKLARKKNLREEQITKTMLSNAARPLDEMELACILSVKCGAGWTVRNSKQWKKAQRVAAQLAGHYIFGKTCGEIAKIVGKEEKAVTKFCERSRVEYFTKLVRGPVPEEARAALARGILRELYPPAVTSGQLGWGEYDAQISAVFPEPEKLTVCDA
jgi:hypothetical protein